MRAAVLHSIEDAGFDIRDDVEAVGPGPGQVRIRVRASGVCHSDLSARNGGLPQPLPAILGHEAAGDVIAVGDGVAVPGPRGPGHRQLAAAMRLLPVLPARPSRTCA